MGGWGCWGCWCSREVAPPIAAVAAVVVRPEVVVIVAVAFHKPLKSKPQHRAYSFLAAAERLRTCVSGLGLKVGRPRRHMGLRLGTWDFFQGSFEPSFCSFSRTSGQMCML